VELKIVLNSFKFSQHSLNKFYTWSLQEKLDIIPALTESNRALRLEKEKVEKVLEETRHQVQELEPLQDKLKEMAEKEEKSQNVIKALRQEGSQWKQKANQFMELNKKLSPEELKKLEAENARLGKQVQQLQNNVKLQTAQVLSLTNHRYLLKRGGRKPTSLTSVWASVFCA